MRWSNELSIGFLMVLFGALCLPGIGEYVAIIFIGLSMLPITTVQHWFGISNALIAAGIVAASFFFLGVFGFVKAFFQRHPSDFCALGILSWGCLAITVAAYFRLGQGWITAASRF
jgi:hypothetical protein